MAQVKNGIAYLLYLAIFFMLGYLVSDHLNIIGLQEVLNALCNLDITNIFCVIVGIEILFIILTVVVGIVKNLDAEKGLKSILFTMMGIVIETGTFVIYSLIFK